jgi:hypothetical protein
MRDAEGSFLLATSRRLQAVQSALTAEAEALRGGVRLIHSVTTGPVVMETDSLELVIYGGRGPSSARSLHQSFVTLTTLLNRFLPFL